MLQHLSIPLYLIESSVCLLVLYTFYHSMLKNETHFQLNRIYLIFAAMASIVIPILNLDLSATHTATSTDALFPVLSEISAFQNGIYRTIERPSNVLQISIADVVKTVYLGGFFFMTLKMMRSLFSLFGIIRRSPRFKDKDHTLLISDDVPAASFFSYIFWNSKLDRDDKIQDTILKHELVHVKQWHSLDVIAMELMVIIKWFNPLIYLFRNSLRKTHEYIADRYVTAHLDKHAYATILLSNAGSDRIPLGASSFYSHARDRVKMMARRRSASASRWRYLLAIPLLLCLLTLFSFDLSDRLPQPIKTSLEAIEQTVIATADQNLISLGLDQEKEEQKFRLTWTEAVNLVIEQKNATQEVILNYSKSDLDGLLTEEPTITQAGRKVRVVIDTIEVLRNNIRSVIEIAELGKADMRKMLLDSMEVHDQLIVNLRAFSDTDSLKLVLHLGLDHGANNLWHYTSQGPTHSIYWGRQRIDFQNMRYENGSYLNIGNIISRDDIDAMLMDKIKLSIDGAAPIVLDDTYQISFTLDKVENRKLASVTVDHPTSYSSHDDVNKKISYLSNQYDGSLYNVLEHTPSYSISSFYQEKEIFSEWLNQAEHGDYMNIVIRNLEEDQEYHLQLKFQDSDDAVNPPFPIAHPATSGSFSRYQLVTREEGKSLIRLDASARENADLIEMYSNSPSYEIVDIPDFRSKSRFYESNLPMGNLVSIDMENYHIQHLDILRLKEYYVEEDELIRLDWGKMVSMPHTGNYSIKEFRRSSKTNLNLFVGKKNMSIKRYDLVIIPENGKILRYRTDKINTQQMRQALKDVPENTSIYIDHIIIDAEDELMSLPYQFVFTIE